MGFCLLMYVFVWLCMLICFVHFLINTLQKHNHFLNVCVQFSTIRFSYVVVNYVMVDYEVNGAAMAR